MELWDSLNITSEITESRLMEKWRSRPLTPGQQLQLFLAQVEELRRTQLYRQNGGLGFRVSIYREGEGPPDVTGQVDLPDVEHVRSFLLTFRQLAVLQSDNPVLVTSVCNTYFRVLNPDDELREELVQWRRAWRRVQQTNTVGSIGTMQVTNEKLADIWINGYYFHREPAKILHLSRLLEGDPMPATVAFIQYLINAAREIDRLALLVDKGLADGSLK